MFEPLRPTLTAGLAAAVVAVAAAPAAATTQGLTLADAVRWAQAHSPAARRLALEARRDALHAGSARREAWPDVSLELAAPSWAQDFSVALAPSDSAGAPREVYIKTTTTSRSAAGDLRLRQLLPWRGRFTGLGSVYYRDESTSPSGIRGGRNDYQVSASIGVDVPLLGDDPDRRALARAGLEQERVRARERSARAELEFDTVSRYLSLLRAGSLLEITRAADAQAEQSYAVAERKAAAGLLAAAEVLKTDVYRADRRVRLAAAEADLARAHDEFKVFLGIPVADTLQLLEELQPFAAPETAEPWVERALRERTDVGLVERDIALLVRERAARRPNLPAVDLYARYGGSASEALFDRAVEQLSANALSLQLSLRVPLWDAGRADLDDGADLAAIELRRLDAADARARIELEVRDAVRQMQDAARRHAVLEASSRLAVDLARISAERFERGLIDAQTSLAAQIDAASARLGAEAALLDLYQAHARLRFVTLDQE